MNEFEKMLMEIYQGVGGGTLTNVQVLDMMEAVILAAGMVGDEPCPECLKTQEALEASERQVHRQAATIMRQTEMMRAATKRLLQFPTVCKDEMDEILEVVDLLDDRAPEKAALGKAA